MSGIIRVTPEELRAMSLRYKNESAQVDEQIERLNNMIDELAGIWEGESSTAFKEQYYSLRPSFEKMSHLLDEVHEQLRNTANALDEADRQIASQIRG